MGMMLVLKKEQDIHSIFAVLLKVIERKQEKRKGGRERDRNKKKRKKKGRREKGKKREREIYKMYKVL